LQHRPNLTLVTDTERPVFNDRYEVQSRIGRGGMADVFLARDRLLDRPVAVKVLFPEHASDPNFVERFKREAQSAANLTHPNIVGVYDWGKQGTTYFIVMEYVNGRSLADIIRSDGALLPQRAADITNDVAAALGFAHSSGVVHRDIKPGNILVSPAGNVKVADFGIARALNSAAEAGLTQVGAVMGTASYFSPEQAQGANPDPRSDLYSLGIVMYEMVSGRPPFTGENPVSIAYKQVHETPTALRELVPDVPLSYDAIVTKLLAKSPSNRYSNAEELRLDLKRFREGGTVGVAAGPAPTDRTIANAPTTPAAGTAMVKPAPATTVQPRQSGAVVAPAKRATAPVKPAPPRQPVGPTKRPVGPPTGPAYDEPRRTGWYIAASVLGIALIGVVGLFLSKALGKKEKVVAPPTTATKVTVPSLSTKTKEEAQNLVVSAKLIGALEPVFSEKVATGIVWDQDPPAGTLVDPLTTVKIIFNPGRSKKILPTLTGKTLEEARATLATLNLTAADPATEVESDLAPGTVIDQDPKPGEVEAGTKVKLTVSKGKSQVKVPNVALYDQVLATTTLRDAGFTVVSETVPNDSVQLGQIVGTDPPGDTLLDKGAKVKLIISGGVNQVDLPDLKDLSEADARAKIQALGMPAPTTAALDVPFDSAQAGKVIQQNPGAGKVSKKAVVNLTIGRALPAPTTTTTSTTLPPTTTSTVAVVAPQLKVTMKTVNGFGPFTFTVAGVTSGGNPLSIATTSAGESKSSPVLTGTTGQALTITWTPTATWTMTGATCLDSASSSPTTEIGTFDGTNKVTVTTGNVKNASTIACTITVTKA
jgi:eukaryotic-like serine/threonine-protein kinase